jgi:hypothetical protein
MTTATTKKPSLANLIDSTNIPVSLVRAVVRQMGGWESFKQSAPDITRHGISGGFHGFIYYSDTIAFAKRNRKAILEMATWHAEHFGEGLVEMIKGFGCFRHSKPSESEIVEALAGRGTDTQVPNALAWYAGEAVARAYCDMTEEV